MGPKARRLGHPTGVQVPEPTHPDENGQAVAADSPQDQPIPIVPTLQRPGRHSAAESRSPGLARLAVIMASVLLLILILAVALVVTLSGLSSRFGSDQQQLSGQINSGERQLSGQINSAHEGRFLGTD